MADTGAVDRRPTLRIGGRAVEFAPGARVEREKPRVDIVIVFDTTGSMSDKRGALASGMSEFVRSLDNYGLDWRVSVLPFGDLEVGDRIVSDYPFVRSADAAVTQLQQMPSFSGGGNDGESSIEAMSAALGKTWRARALKVIVLLTDDSALSPERAPQITGRLVQTDSLCFTSALDTPYYREWAAATGGTWSRIGAAYDASSIHEALRRLLRDVAHASEEVHRVALGSPQRFRALGQRRP